MEKSTAIAIGVVAGAVVAGAAVYYLTREEEVKRDELAEKSDKYAGLLNRKERKGYNKELSHRIKKQKQRLAARAEIREAAKLAKQKMRDQRIAARAELIIEDKKAAKAAKVDIVTTDKKTDTGSKVDIVTKAS
jgi:hypothetical protein